MTTITTTGLAAIIGADATTVNPKGLIENVGEKVDKVLGK